MGTIMSVLDGCVPSSDSPAAYMEEELKRDARIKKQIKRQRMDIMGVAMDAAMHDIRHMVGIQSDNEERAEEEEEYQNMTMIKRNYFRKRRDSDTTNNSHYRDDLSSRGGDAYYEYLERKKEEARLRAKAKQQVSNSKKIAKKPRLAKVQSSELDNSTTNIQRIANPAGTYNPTGGVLSSRKFGQKAGGNFLGASLNKKQAPKSKGVFKYGGHNNLLDESTGDVRRIDTFADDDNMSIGDVRRIGDTSEFDSQSEMSINQYMDNSDTESLNIVRLNSRQSDTSLVLTDLKRNQSNWDASSQYTDSSVLMIDDAGSNLGSVISETTIKKNDSQYKGASKLGLPSIRGGRRRLMSNGGSSTNIINDDQSQGYGMDSEMDAQELINNLGDGDSVMFIEGESELSAQRSGMFQVREDDEEMDNSFEQARRTYGHKKPKSLDDFDGEEEEDRMNANLNEKQNEGNNSAQKQRKSTKQPRKNFLDDLNEEEVHVKRNSFTEPDVSKKPKKIDSGLYINKGDEIREDEENEFQESDSDEELNFRQRRSYNIEIHNAEAPTPQQQAVQEHIENHNEELDSAKLSRRVSTQNDNSQHQIQNLSILTGDNQEPFRMDSDKVSAIDDMDMDESFTKVEGDDSNDVSIEKKGDTSFSSQKQIMSVDNDQLDQDEQDQLNISSENRVLVE